MTPSEVKALGSILINKCFIARSIFVLSAIWIISLLSAALSVKRLQPPRNKVSKNSSTNRCFYQSYFLSLILFVMISKNDPIFKNFSRSKNTPLLGVSPVKSYIRRYKWHRIKSVKGIVWFVLLWTVEEFMGFVFFVMMCPPSIKITWLATSRAKPISWVTTTMVTPSWANCFMTSKTSPTNSGSSAEVGSSSKITSGFTAMARVPIRCWLPDNCEG